VSQPKIEAALEKYTQIISDNDFPGIAVVLNAAPRHQLERMVGMLLSDEDPASIEAFKKALGIASVNAHLLAAQEAAERRAERAQNESWVHCLASRLFLRRPIAMKEAFGNLPSLTSALCKWMADSLFALGMGSFTGTRFELWRVAIFEAFSQAADKGVFPIGLPPVEALARSLADKYTGFPVPGVRL
jgi:hypothetical protein